MLDWFKKIFTKKSKIDLRKATPDQVISDDPFTREIVAAAWNSKSGVVVGNVDDDGNLTIHEEK